MTNAIFERTRPIQYSGLSGRMYYVPAPRVQTQQLLPEQKDLVKEREIKQEQEELDEAYDRNRRMRLWQLQRASRRLYGDYNYHRTFSAEPPIGTTPETMPY